MNITYKERQELMELSKRVRNRIYIKEVGGQKVDTGIPFYDTIYPSLKEVKEILNKELQPINAENESV